MTATRTVSVVLMNLLDMWLIQEDIMNWRIFEILFFFIAMIAAMGNAYSLWNGEVSRGVVGWVVSAFLFFAIIINKIGDIDT